MAETKAVYYGTGRRKTSVARVRLVPGTGQMTVNKKTGLEFFGRQALVNFAETPFKATETSDRFDVIAQCHGGGVSGQAGALRHGIARALLEASDEYRGELKRAGVPASRPPYGRAQEVRPEEGPQEAAVLQALGLAAHHCNRPGLAARAAGPVSLMRGLA